MVLSNLDKSINYKEIKKLSDDDIDFETNVYSGELFDKYIEFTVGKPKFLYNDKNIIFYYIYLINKNDVVLNIGIFEIISSNYNNLIDDNGNLIFSKLSNSLIFDFVENYLNKNYTLSDLKSNKIDQTIEKTTISQKGDDKKGDDELIKKSLDKLKVTEKIDNKIIKLKEESKEDAEEEKRIYIDNKTNNWIEKFLKNNNYSIINNEAGGDCLFASIRDGLDNTEKKTSVQELRIKLSQEMTQEIYDSYKEKYTMFSEQYNKSKELLKTYKRKNNELKDLIKVTKLKEKELDIINENKVIIQLYNEERSNNQLIASLYEEFKYMKNINNVNEFKEYIKKDGSCHEPFWGDTWAISTIERIINIKLILLSKENYLNDDINNVLQCGQLNDEILESQGNFNPSYYIILDYNGDHYQLVTYKKHTAFTFSEIPYSIKELIVRRCLEKQAGPFYLIPDFRQFAISLNVDEKSLVKDIDVNEPSQLYDEDIVFQFYIKSNGKPKPGKGNGEKIPDEKIKDFSKLSKIDNWRRKLSNLWDENILIIGGKQWKSVEHFIQANKFKKTNPEYFEQFSLDSDSELSKDPILAKQAGSTSSKSSTKQIRPSNVVIDPDFSKKRDLITYEALYAKFTQHDELKNLIINTQTAKLLNYQVGDKAIIADDLMKVRSKIIS